MVIKLGRQVNYFIGQDRCSYISYRPVS